MVTKKSLTSYLSVRKLVFCLAMILLFLRLRLTEQHKRVKTCGESLKGSSCNNSFKERNFCKDSFELSIAPKGRKTNNSNWPCYVQPPTGYSASSTEKLSLWKVRRAVLGKLNERSEMYGLYINHQRWAKIEKDYVHILEQGGTAGRAFKDNFEYVKTLLKNMNVPPLSTEDSAPLMLDMGGGIGSVAAALKDPRGGNGSIRAVTYVLPDENLRLQAIISHRGLPSYVARFNGKVPFPNKSFFIVHCKWCWHHLVGYDKWLKEVNRVMAVGGYFVFTFTPDPHEMLKYPDWDDALQKQGFECIRKSRIIMICQRSSDKQSQFHRSNLRDLSTKNDIAGNGLTTLEKRRFISQTKKIKRAYIDAKGTFPSRVLNINCRKAEICKSLEEYLEADFVMHLGNRPDKAIIKALLNQRQIAMFHDWDRYNHIPMYPRSVDMALIGCTKSTRHLITQDEFWTDIHRLLIPGGIVGITRSLCTNELEKMEKILQRTFFFTVWSSANNVILRKF